MEIVLFVINSRRAASRWTLGNLFRTMVVECTGSKIICFTYHLGYLQYFFFSLRAFHCSGILDLAF